MDDSKQIGRELAERAYVRIRDGLSNAETATLFAQEVAQRARAMQMEANSGKDIADWVEAVSDAYGARSTN